MSAKAIPSPVRAGRRPLRALAGVLSVVCLVLLLVAVEQKQAVAAWSLVVDEAVPAARRLAGWAGQLPKGTADGWAGLRAAVAGDGGPPAADPDDMVLTGEYGPADAPTRQATGGAAFAGAMIRLENCERFRTVPARIVSGRDVFSATGQSFAEAFDARADAQIELRRIVPDGRTASVAGSTLCQGGVPGIVALLHRGDRVDAMLFRDRTMIGPEAPPSGLCGQWTFRAR